MGVFSTSIAADRDRAVAAGATPLAEPIVTDVGGRRLAMALIRTPGGARAELLSVARNRTRRMEGWDDRWFSGVRGRFSKARWSGWSR
ncbi:hypothetical protein ACIP3B_33830 [Streptomyces anulatus]|uniref:hypothetical protein n=1 Tax=Streptomyces anulatus TaxID=1892 RepID=UPI00340FF96F